MKKIYSLIIVATMVSFGWAQPVRNWGTYYGGALGDDIYSVTTDISGNVYVAGKTFSFAGISTVGSHQAVLGGAQDAFVAKFSSAGVLIWATYYGGTATDYGSYVVVDGSENVYLSGYTNSTTGISTIGSHQAVYGGATDAFLVKFNSSGVRQWGTYYGGTALENGISLEVDAINNVYLVGNTASTNSISTVGSHQVANGGGSDVFIAVFNGAGVRQWATYYGGTGTEVAPSINVDLNNNIYLAAHTNSLTGISTIGSHQDVNGGGTNDAFLVQFNNSGVRQWSTYYGGTGNENDITVASDLNGNVQIGGQTTSTTAIGTVGSHQAAFGGGTFDVYVVQFNSMGVRQWGTYYGGAGSEYKPSLATDQNGNIYLGGYTTSPANISTVGSHQPVHGGGTYSALLVQFSNTGSRQWGTYYGGSGADYAYSVAVGPGGNIYIAGTTASATTISTVGSHQATYGGGLIDGFIVQFIGCIAAPSQPSSITGATTVCNGSSHVYSVTNDPTAFSYTWTLPGSWTGTSTTNSINATVGATGGNITVTANNACGNSTAQSITATVIDVPATPSVITGNTTVCNGNIEIYDVTNDPLAINYTWVLPVGWSGSSTTNSISATVGSTGGNITVAANNFCGTSATEMVTISVIDILPIPSSISGGAVVCNSASELYTVINNPAATGYTWTLPGSWSGSSATNSISATVGVSGGNITVTVDNACGSSIPQSLAITTNDVPALPSVVTGNTTVCNGSAQTYSVTNDPGASGYIWSLPGSWTGTSITNSINATAGVAGGNVSVVANNACGNSGSQILAVAVDDVPATPVLINGNVTACNGSFEAYDVTNDPLALDYTWSLPIGWGGTSISNSISATVGPTGGDVSVFANNACGNSATQTLTISVIDVLAPPSAINGNIVVCNGTVEIYDVTNDPAASGYTWTVPGTWSGTSTSNSISATAGASFGNITVTADNACGSSFAQSLAVAVNDIPALPSAISGNATPCEGNIETYDVIDNPLATSYSWSLPGSWTGASLTNSIDATVGATSGIITVIANNTCGSSAAQTLVVVASVIPAQPSVIAGAASVCEGSAQIYSVTNDPTASDYTWTLPGTWTGSSIIDNISSTVGTSGGTISVTAANLCGTSVPQTLVITVNNLPIVTLTLGSDFACVYSPVFALSGGSPAGGTYSGTGVTAGDFDPATAGVGSYTITYTVTDGNSCTNFNTDQITVDGCLSVFTNETELSFNVYPNPFAESFTLVTNTNLSLSQSFIITNVVGEIVLRSIVNGPSMVVDMSELAPGIYLLILNDGSNTNVKKIIKN